MPTIFVKDELRASVEAATGGQCTVLYTAKGAPSHMFIVPKFKKEDIDAGLGTGVHEMFIVNGVERSERFVGVYGGVALDNQLVSLPGVIPSVNQTLDTFRGIATANGPGWGITTNADRAGIALWCWKNGFLPRGNTSYGRSDANPFETGRRADNGVPGTAIGDGKTLTGSGPNSWRHNGQSNGIADLCGNTNDWVSGLRLMDGEIQILPNNDAADSTKDQSATSTLWKAIDAATGNLVAPGTAGTLKYDAAGAVSGYGSVASILSDAVTNSTGDDAYCANTFEGLGKKSGLTVPAIAKSLGLYPVAATGLGGDFFWMRNHGERLPLVGGHWDYGAIAGVFALNLNSDRADASWGVGARPAYYL